MSSQRTVSPKFPKKLRNSVSRHGNIINKSLDQLLNPTSSAPRVLPKVGQNDYSQMFLIESAGKLEKRKKKHSGGQKKTARRKQKRRKTKRCWI